MKTKKGNGISKSFFEATVSANENTNSANVPSNQDSINIIPDAVRTTSGNVPLTSDAVLPTSEAIRRKKNAALRTTDAIRLITDATLHPTDAVRRNADATRRTCAHVRLFKGNVNFFCFSGERKNNNNRHFSVFQSIRSFFTFNTQFNPIINHP
jgi:hypothetical protein